MDTINTDDIRELASLGCTEEEIAASVRVSAEALAEHGEDEIRSGRCAGPVALRRKQHEVALKGSVPMLIWLGKQRLGQSDKPEAAGRTNLRDIVMENARALRQRRAERALRTH